MHFVAHFGKSASGDDFEKPLRILLSATAFCQLQNRKVVRALIWEKPPSWQASKKKRAFDPKEVHVDHHQHRRPVFLRFSNSRSVFLSIEIEGKIGSSVRSKFYDDKIGRPFRKTRSE